ncbi:MAG: glycosyltransferase family 39 protein [Blastocatellia bacterium]
MTSFAWKREYRCWLPLAGVAWLLAWLARDPFMADWDSFDYAACVVQGTPSPLGLGRALFLACNRVLWLVAHYAFGWSPDQAYLLIKYGVIAQSGLAIVGLYALYRELTAESRAALLAALLVALSPLYVVYSGRGMSEIPGVLWWAWSLWWMMRSLRRNQTVQYLLAAVLFGLSANVREFAVFYLPLVALAGWIYGQRWKVWMTAFGLACVAAVAGPVYWALAWPEYYLPAVRTWYALSAQERLEHPVTLRNVWLLAGYAFICSPAAFLLTPVSIRNFRRAKIRAHARGRVWVLTSLFGLLSVLALVANHDLALNPRYLLTGLLGLAPLCGWWLAEWSRERTKWRNIALAMLASLTVISLIGAAIFLHRVQWPHTVAARDYAAMISTLPEQSVFLVGRRTPLVNYYQRIGAHPGWQTIPFGSGWPDARLGEVVDDYLKAGRPVFVDFDETIWSEGMREHSREAAGLELLRRNYQLEPVKATLFRVVGKNKP